MEFLSLKNFQKALNDTTIKENKVFKNQFGCTLFAKLRSWGGGGGHYMGTTTNLQIALKYPQKNP